MFAELWRDIRDRLSGNKQRANARWGWVKPPAGQSKLIWIRAGKTRDSVLLAAGLMAAIRHKRQDVRLVLTYQQEYQDIIVEHLSGLKKIGFGYSCAPHVAIESRMLNRLSPFAIIFVEEVTGNAIFRALEKFTIKHLIAFQTSIQTTHRMEASYPAYPLCDENKKELPQADLQHEHPSFEAITLLVQTQIDKQLGALLCGSKIEGLFLVHGVNKLSAYKMLDKWQGSALDGKSILAFSLEEPTGQGLADLIQAIQHFNYQVVLLSTWDRQPLTAQHIVIIDERRWLAALAVSAVAVHLIQFDKFVLWQSIASGSVISIDNTVRQNLPDICQQLPQVDHLNVINDCQEWLNNPPARRRLGDDTRRLFWQQRRLAEQGIDDLLQRVFDW